MSVMPVFVYQYVNLILSMFNPIKHRFLVFFCYKKEQKRHACFTRITVYVLTSRNCRYSDMDMGKVLLVSQYPGMSLLIGSILVSTHILHRSTHIA